MIFPLSLNEKSRIIAARIDKNYFYLALIKLKNRSRAAFCDTALAIVPESRASFHASSERAVLLASW